MSAPGSVLLFRALHHLDGARLQLEAGQPVKAAESIEKAVAVLKELTDQ